MSAGKNGRSGGQEEARQPLSPEASKARRTAAIVVPAAVAQNQSSTCALDGRPSSAAST